MLPKEQRLTARRDFNRVYGHRKAQYGPSLILYHLPRDPDSVSAVRFGFVTSRKVGRAHDRNRTKRRLREIARRMLRACSPSTDLVVVARNGAADCSQAALERELHDLLRRAGLLSGGESTS